MSEQPSCRSCIMFGGGREGSLSTCTSHSPSVPRARKVRPSVGAFCVQYNRCLVLQRHHSYIYPSCCSCYDYVTELKSTLLFAMFCIQWPNKIFTNQAGQMGSGGGGALPRPCSSVWPCCRRPVSLGAYHCAMIINVPDVM